MTFGWFDLATFGLVLAGALLYVFPKKTNLKASGEEFARTHLAYVDSEFVDEFDRAELRDRRIAAAVLVGAIVPVWLISRFAPRADDVFPGVFAVAIALIALLRLSHAGREFPPPPGRVAVARTRTVQVRDYVHPSLLWLCVVLELMVLAVGALATRAAATGSTEMPGDEAIAIAFASGLVTVPALVGPLYLLALCRKPEPAVDAAHLYFQDAWRSVQMQAAVAAWLFAAALAVIPSLWFLPEWVLSSAVLPVAGLGFFLWALWAGDRTKLRFREQLWPSLQPGQVLMPGETPIGGNPR